MPIARADNVYYYRVTDCIRNGSRVDFPSVNGGRYQGITPMKAAEKAARIAAHKYGVGKYKLTMYETTQKSHHYSNTYEIQVTKNTTKRKFTVPGAEKSITPSPFSVEVLTYAQI